MTQEDKQLLLADLCARLPYGVKILYEGWDYDRDCEFATIEELIGIDDRFIYTIWRDEKDKHSIKEPLSITDYKPYLRPMSSMTEEEKDEMFGICTLSNCSVNSNWEFVGIEIMSSHPRYGDHYSTDYSVIDWLNKNMFDYRGLIEKGLAIEAPEGMYES